MAGELTTTNEDSLDGWSERQKKVYSADVQENIDTKRLSTVMPGQTLIRGVPGLGDGVDYYVAKVKSVGEDDLVVEFTADQPRTQKVNKVSGVADYGPDYGWVFPEDDSSPTIDKSKIKRVQSPKNR